MGGGAARRDNQNVNDSAPARAAAGTTRVFSGRVRKRMVVTPAPTIALAKRTFDAVANPLAVAPERVESSRTSFAWSSAISPVAIDAPSAASEAPPATKTD